MHRLWLKYDGTVDPISDILAFRVTSDMVDPAETRAVDGRVVRLSVLVDLHHYVQVAVDGVELIVPVDYLRVIPDERPVRCRRLGTEQPGLGDHPDDAWSRDGRIRVTRADGPRHPDGAVRFGRSLMAGPAWDGFNLSVALYDHEPREWPPMHSGCTVAGVSLTADQARLLRDALDSWLGKR